MERVVVRLAPSLHSPGRLPEHGEVLPEAFRDAPALDGYCRGRPVPQDDSDSVAIDVHLGSAFENRFAKKGAVTRIEVAPDDDLRALASRIAALHPDAVYFALVVNSQDSFLRRVREQDVRAMMLAPAALSSSVIHASGDAAEGVCKTDLPVPDTPAAQHIAEQYRMKYGTDPAILQFVLLGHDAAQILAALPAGNTTAALSDVAYRSAAGDIINLSSGGAAERLEEVFCVRNETVVRS